MDGCFHAQWKHISTHNEPIVHSCKPELKIPFKSCIMQVKPAESIICNALLVDSLKTRLVALKDTRVHVQPPHPTKQHFWF